jgi:hypothetical protein
MSESLRVWVEVFFNVAYLVVVWGIVVAMLIKRDTIRPADRRVADLIWVAFGLLALGDTGHVGFRVAAYAMSDLNATISIFGVEMGLVGLGALATAITVTFFYMLMLVVWHERYQKPYGWFGYLLFAVAIFRLLIMTLPANEWNNPVPPQPWGMIRNLPLTIQGLGLAYLVLRDARLNGDRAFTWIGISILVSYAMYIPVILFVQQLPMIGMLMIPKTIAYLVIAFIAYNELFRSPGSVSLLTETGR